MVHAAVAEPRFDATRQRVTGVLLGFAVMRWTPTSSSTRPGGARGSRCGWSSGALAGPREDTVEVGIAYATHQVHIPEGLLKEKVVVAGASRAEPIGLGMLFYEDGNWGLTTFGIDKVEPPQNFAEMCDAGRPDPA